MEDAIDLQKGFSEQETRNAINELGKEKALGTDGLTLLSSRIVGTLSRGTLWVSSPTSMREAFFKKSLNATFLTLLLKIAGGEDIMNLKPISLIRSVYKNMVKSPCFEVKESGP